MMKILRYLRLFMDAEAFKDRQLCQVAGIHVAYFTVKFQTTKFSVSTRDSMIISVFYYLYQFFLFVSVFLFVSAFYYLLFFVCILFFLCNIFLYIYLSICPFSRIGKL